MQSTGRNLTIMNSKVTSTVTADVLSLLICLYTSADAVAAHAPSPADFADNTTGLEFVEIPPGSFIMGTDDLEPALAEMSKPDAALIADETPAHNVVFKHSFYMSTTEVTQQAWFGIMHTRPGPPEHWHHEHWQQLPVVSVSWDDAQQFIKLLNSVENRFNYRLPTEAEWEYAARAGDTGLRPFNKLDMDEYAWYLLSSNDQVQPVAKLRPNAFGLYDMMGNVWEWVSDWYEPDTYAQSKTLNPTGPATGDKKVRRGGSYHCPPHLIRPGYRAADKPDKTFSVLGFRLIAEPR